MRKHLLLLLFLCFSLTYARSQASELGTPGVTSFSRSDYQAGTQNWMIQQDDRGLLYFANNKGLLEFDGTTWQIFALPNRTIVRSFAFAEEGKIYVGGQNEIGFLAPNVRGKKVYTSLTHLIPEALKSFEDIWKIFVQPEGVFFCSEKAVFYLQGKEIKVILPPNDRFENFFEQAGKLYVQDQVRGLFLLQGEQLRLYPNGDLFINQRITALLPYQNGQSLIATLSNGLFLLNETGIRPWQTTASDFLIRNRAYCATQLEDGGYAFGTSQNGLLIIDPDGQALMHLNKEKGLQNNTILSICQDIQQNLWLGLDNGIDYAEINSPFSIIRSEARIEGTGYASTIHQGKLYLGTNQGLFYTDWDGGKDAMRSKKFELVQNATGQVWSINDLDNSLILGQHKGASYLKDNQAIPFSSIQGAWKFMRLQTDPSYAIEGTYTGLVLYKDRNATQDEQVSPDWQMIKKLEGFDESARIFEQDKDGHIWVSHAYKGLFKIELSNDFTSIQKISFYNSTNGLPSDLFINAALIRNELVFTTLKGIYKYDKANDRFIPHQDFDDIFGKNRNIHRLMEDKMGNVWFSIDNEFGILKVEEKGVFNKLKIAYFNQIQEELVDGFEHVYAHDSENVFIGTEKGFIHYNPSQNKNIDFPFSILIRKVISITSTDSTVYWGNEPYDTTTQAFDFTYKMNDFRFAYSAPYYEKIDHVEYRFKLEGFDKTWSNWTAKTEKEYTNLVAGDYHFRVQARNAYGQESKQAIFPFKISPPWYLSLYAKLTYLLLFIAGLAGLFQYISRREKKKTEAFKLEQTRKLELKETEFKKEVEKSEGEIIKLRNEKLRTDINHKNSQLASATMHLVQKSEILIKIKNDLDRLVKEAGPDLKKKIVQITRTIESDIRLDDNWEQFESYFDQVHENFFKRLREEFPNLTPKDQKLCAYLRMNLTTKEIAPLLNISVRGVEISRYRLRKKLDLDSDTNLVAFILQI